MKRVLLTGPLESIADYASAARGVGWEPIEWPILRVVPHRHDVSPLLAQRFDWICVTSSNALAFLGELARAANELRATPCAIVGERSAERARSLGWRVEVTYTDASSLCGDLARIAVQGAHVLWPRGHLSDDLARDLRRQGFVVADPVVYATERIESRTPPAAQAILFASPSGVRAWHALARESATPTAAPTATARTIAIAIGRTTHDALMSETDLFFFDTISLPEPTPEAFASVIHHLDLGSDGSPRDREADHRRGSAEPQ